MDHAFVQSAVEVIESSRPDGQPFCLFLPLHNPHPAYIVEQEFYDRVDPERLPPRLPLPKRALPMLDALREVQHSSELDEAAWREIKRVYYAMCAKVDHLFGRVVAALKRKGIYDDTLIFFLSDHGDFTGDYNMVEKDGGSLEDVLIRSPLLVKPPAAMGATPGIRRQLVELVDMSATIYDLLEIEPGYTCQGRSLRGLLMGSKGEIRDAVFAEAGAHAGEERFLNLDCLQMSRDSFYGARFHVIRPFHMAGSYCVSVRTLTHKYIYRPYTGQHALFDLQADPGELDNLSGRDEWAEVERTLSLRLLRYFAETCDVLPFAQDRRDV